MPAYWRLKQDYTNVFLQATFGFLHKLASHPKMPFGQRHVAINIYNIRQGHLGSRGAKHLKIN